MYVSAGTDERTASGLKTASKPDAIIFRLNAEIPMSSRYGGNRPREGEGDSGERRKQEANAVL